MEDTRDVRSGGELTDADGRTVPRQAVWITYLVDRDTYLERIADPATRTRALDLKVPGAREVVLRLCETADVIIENFRPGTLATFALDYATVAERNPRVVARLPRLHHLAPIGIWICNDANHTDMDDTRARGYDTNPSQVIKTAWVLMQQEELARQSEVGPDRAARKRTRTGRPGRGRGDAGPSHRATPPGETHQRAGLPAPVGGVCC